MTEASYKNKEILYNKYWIQEKCLREISEEYSVSIETIRYWMKKLEIPIREKSKAIKIGMNKQEVKNKITGKNNSSWKGGIMYKDGYRFIKNRNHPNTNNSGYVREHHLIMEEKLGRYLTKEERIHHINYIKDDNRIENLYLCKTSNQHQKIKKSVNCLIKLLIDKKIIKFRNGEYQFAHEN